MKMNQEEYNDEKEEEKKVFNCKINFKCLLLNCILFHNNYFKKEKRKKQFRLILIDDFK